MGNFFKKLADPGGIFTGKKDIAGVFDPGGALIKSGTGTDVHRVADPGGLYSGKDPKLFSSESASANSSTDDKAAAIIREKYDEYLSLGKPIEQQILADLFNPEEMNRQVMESRGLVSAGFESGRNATADFRQRFGNTRTAQEEQFESRRSQIRQALAETETADGVRGMVFDRDVNTAVDLTRIGRGMSSSAQAGMVSAAGKAAEREVANDAAKRADRQSTIGMGVAGATTGFMVGGPVGAAVGGVIGIGVGMMS